MSEFIDCHNHVCWGIDDGVKDIEMAKEVFATAKKDGIRYIISTPHFIPGQSVEEINAIRERQKECQKLGKEFGIAVYTGAEIFLNDQYIDMFENKMFNTLNNSHYVLVEFDARMGIGDRSEVEEKLYEIIVAGYTPIVAHAERYFPSGIDLKRIQGMIDMGCYIQVNRTSLNGSHGKTCLNNAVALLESNMCHMIGTDTHRSKGSRICVLSDVYEMISKDYGKENADILMYENAARVLADKELITLNVKKKSIFKRLFSK